MSNKTIYAEPRLVTDINDCLFYHTMDIPGHGLVKGQFDLRQGVREYLGNVDFRGKRVLELGTASGFLCFYMESQGADVVAYDLSQHHDWDLVPLCADKRQHRPERRRELIRKINNAFWFNHKAFNSNAKMVYGTVYEIPEEIGMVDISTFGAILLHLRDPFLALQNALRLTRETVIVTQGLWPRGLGRIRAPFRIPAPLLALFPIPQIKFVPDHNAPRLDTWWRLSPKVVIRMIAILGFEESTTNYHWQKLGSGMYRAMYTVVGHRTREHYLY
jgi:hypothetical protein